MIKLLMLSGQLGYLFWLPSAIEKAKTTSHFITALLYMMTTGTKISGAQKRYLTALDASYGGAEIVAKDITSFSRIGSIGGFVTCAKSCLK